MSKYPLQCRPATKPDFSASQPPDVRLVEICWVESWLVVSKIPIVVGYNKRPPFLLLQFHPCWFTADAGTMGSTDQSAQRSFSANAAISGWSNAVSGIFLTIDFFLKIVWVAKTAEEYPRPCPKAILRVQGRESQQIAPRQLPIKTCSAWKKWGANQNTKHAMGSRGQMRWNRLNRWSWDFSPAPKRAPWRSQALAGRHCPFGMPLDRAWERHPAQSRAWARGLLGKILEGNHGFHQSEIGCFPQMFS